jgi:hypothetical protein
MIGTTYMPSIHAAFKPHFLFNVEGFSPGAPVFSWRAGVGDAGFHVFLPSGKKYVRIMASLSFLLFEKTL